MIRAAWVLAGAVAAGGLCGAPMPDADPLVPGTRWVGTLSQKGTFDGGMTGPPTFQTVLTVMARDGDRLVAELAESADDVRVTYTVKGTVAPAADGKGFAVRFRSTAYSGAVRTNPVLGVAYTGAVTGKSLRGVWRVPPGARANVEGEFALELTK